MKKNLFCLVTTTILFIVQSFAQSVAINGDGSLPNANAILDVKSFTKGVLIPRVSTTGRLAIPNTKGLLVYDTTTSSFWYNTGITWQNMAATSTSGTGWLLTGNSGTNASHFLGTTDSVPLFIKVNNLPSGRIDAGIPNNTFWGYKAGANTPEITGSDNTAIGSYALEHNLLGYFNTACGSRALNGNTTGFHNTAIGKSSLYTNSTGYENTAVGVGSLYGNTTGYYNTAIGNSSLATNSYGTDNTATGFFSLLSNTTGSYNTAAGSFSLYSNTAGLFNTANGYHSMRLNKGDRNTATGASALEWNTTGFDNTAIGSYTLNNNTTGRLNTAIGAFADVGDDGLINATAIGFGAFVDASYKVRIGNAVVTRIEGAVPFTTPSDGRFKFNVQEDVKGLDFILQLRPVTYQFDAKRYDEQWRSVQKDSVMAAMKDAGKVAYNEASAIRRSGFIAQEVEKAAAASGYTFSGLIKPGTVKEYYSMSYESFVVPLVKGMQELYLEIEKLKKENDLLKEQIKQILQR